MPRLNMIMDNDDVTHESSRVLALCISESVCSKPMFQPSGQRRIMPWYERFLTGVLIAKCVESGPWLRKIVFTSTTSTFG